jgi:hypothetical protein
MAMSLKLTVGIGVATTLVALACSSSTDGGFAKPDPTGPGTSSGASGAGCGLTCGDGGGEQMDAGFGETCASTRVGARRSATHLVIAIDVSTSMCEYKDASGADRSDCSNADSRWAQAKKGLAAFFSSMKAKDVSVTIIPWSGNALKPVCDGSNVSTSIVPVTPLPNAGLSAKLDALKPNGDTGTSAAIIGAKLHAQKLKGELDGSKIATVLVTDGEPNVCPSIDFADPIGSATRALAAAETQARASNAESIPVYVVGVGESLSSLNKLAVAGGTGKAILVDKPAKVATDLLAALENIQQELTGCTLKLPVAKAGESVDFQKVNVELESMGKKNTLSFSETCSAPDGWHYSKTTDGKPVGIELCSSACKIIKDDASSTLSLALGCKSKGIN